MDLLLDSDNDLVFVNGSASVTPDRAGAVQQRLKVKLLSFLGEWYLDTSYGIPYFQQIFGKGRSKGAIDSILQQKILEEDGVLRITKFESSLSTSRTYSLVFAVVVDDGDTTNDIEISVGT